MKVGIIGAGFTGLTAAFELTRLGHEVVVFESMQKPGGLAVGFKKKNWSFTLEHHYHHLFESDKDILQLADRIGHKISFKKAKTATFLKGDIYQLDSPLNLLMFKPLPILDRLRMGVVLGLLKSSLWWKPLEKTTFEIFAKKTMGDDGWKVLWKPLMVKKFGRFYKSVSASWFWARIKKRSVKLGYPSGGFLNLARSIEKKIIENKGSIKYSVFVSEISGEGEQVVIATTGGKNYKFDKVLCTLPTGLFNKLIPKKKQIIAKKKYIGLGAVNLVLVLKKSFFKNGIYWLNINEIKYPFLAIVEHTNLVNPRNYDNEKILYIGNYLLPDHSFFSKSADELINIFFPYLIQINKDFKKNDIKKAYIFKANFAQPVIYKNYSRHLPPIKTKLKNVYIANIQQVYPWDRGTNYAVELGIKAVKNMMSDI